MIESLIQVAFDLLGYRFAQLFNRLVHIVCDGLGHEDVGVAVEAFEVVFGLLEVEAVALVAMHEHCQRKFAVAQAVGVLVVFHQQYRDSFYFLGDQHYLFGVDCACCVPEQEAVFFGECGLKFDEIFESQLLEQVGFLLYLEFELLLVEVEKEG